MSSKSKKRRCKYPGCGTLLSSYHKSDYCYLHENKRALAKLADHIDAGSDDNQTRQEMGTTERTQLRLYTVREVAEILRCDEKTIRRRIADGVIKARKVPRGRPWLIRAEEVERLAGSMGEDTSAMREARLPSGQRDSTDWVSILRPITLRTLEQAAEEASKRLAAINRLKLRQRDKEYMDRCNEEAFVGSCEWHHLYMGAYGAFHRPAKEEQVLAAIRDNALKLIRREHGLILHVISGDSGCGKSTLAKLVIQRLVEADLGRFRSLETIRPRFQVLEVVDIQGVAAARHGLMVECRRDGRPPPFWVVYLDDLFSPDNREHIEVLLGVLAQISEVSPVYFLATSPDWHFHKGELQKLKHRFRLEEAFETRIEGLDPEDREALENQYREMFGEWCSEHLLELIRQEEELILVKLTLHQNLHYSEYIENVLTTLKHDEVLHPYLAALLISSSVSRFGVHLSLNVVEQLNSNHSLPRNKRVPCQKSIYEGFSDRGFKLFRIRPGRGNLPDTVAPFHDRIASVICSTWGEEKPVPPFERPLWELEQEVLGIIEESAPQLMPNIYAGMLRGVKKGLTPATRLQSFIRNFGPIRRGRWWVVGKPLAEYRWIAVAKSDPDSSRDLLEQCTKVLDSMARKKDENQTEACLALTLLEPRCPHLHRNREWMRGIERLGEEHFPLLYGALDEFLQLKPTPAAFLADFLDQLGEWVLRYPRATDSALSYRYLIVSSLADSSVRDLRFLPDLNEAIKRIVKSYLLNVSQEYKTYKVLGARLIRNVRWSVPQARRLFQVIEPYVKDEANWYRPVLFERLLDFMRYGKLEKPSGEELFALLVDISLQLPRVSSLTYSAKAFFKHLEELRRTRLSEYRKTLERIRDYLLSEGSEHFRKTAGYPDFVRGFLEHAPNIERRFQAEELAALLRPLVELPEEHPETKYAFRAARRLFWGALSSFLDQAQALEDRQIRLYMAEPGGLALDVVLGEFTELLVEDKLTIPVTVCASLNRYLRSKRKDELSPGSIQRHRDRIYRWLHHKRARSEEAQEKAVPVFLLTCSRILFSKKHMKDLEPLAQKSLETYEIIPFGYLKWWLAEEAPQVLKERRYALLDAFWAFMLRKSSQEVVYESDFLFLLDKYGIDRDEYWWGHRAVPQLLEKFHTLWATSKGRRPRRVKRTRRGVNQETKRYKQRILLQRMMDTILESHLVLKSELQGGFEREAMGALMPYSDQPWALRWLGKLGLGRETDITERFLEYLTAVEAHPPASLAFDIRKHVRHWHLGMLELSQEPVSELKRVWEWLDRPRPPSLSVFLVGSLLRQFPKELRGFEVGALVEQILRWAGAGLRPKSELVRRYLGWLAEDKHQLLGREREKFEGILRWSLSELLHATPADLPPILYGSQTLFQAALKHKVDLEPQKAKRAFFRALEICIGLEGGACIARDYFAWLFHSRAETKISEYLEWIRLHRLEAQAPWVLCHLIHYLTEIMPARTVSASSLEHDLSEVWYVLKLLIQERLECEGTTEALEALRKHLIRLQSMLILNEAKLNEISKESYELGLALSNHPRIVYLVLNMPVFQSNLRPLLDRPSPQEILALWRNLPASLRKCRGDDSFVMLVRQINESLEEEEELRDAFCQDLLAHIRTEPWHWISPKFANLVIDDVSYVTAHPHCLEGVCAMLPSFIELQADLKEVGYSIRKCLRRLNIIMCKDDRVDYEVRLMDPLEHNIWKSGSAACIFQLVKHCTPGAHYQRIVALMLKHLGRSNVSERVVVTKEIVADPETILDAHRQYVEGYQVEHKESLHADSAEQILKGIEENARALGMPRWFSASLRTWPNHVPQDLAVAALRALCLQQRFGGQVVDDLIQACERLQESFGRCTLLSPTLSVETVIERLRVRGDAGLILIRSDLGQGQNAERAAARDDSVGGVH